MNRSYLYAGGFSVVLSAALVARAGDHNGAAISTTVPLSSLGDVHLVKPIGGKSISVLPLNAAPINGFVPQVVFGLTDEQDRNDFTFAAKSSSFVGGNTLPTVPAGSSPKYFVATYDTGSQSHLISFADEEAFNLDGANRLGDSTAQVIGASGVEDADVSDGLGIYITGLSHATVSGSNINVTGSLKGQWNTSILSAQPTSQLPNLIGSPMAAQYQTVIKNSQTRTLNVGTNSYHSPEVSLQSLNTALPAGYSKLTLDVKSVNGVSADPVFFPSLENINNVADNPATPTFFANYYANTNLSHSGGASSQSFLFDTGAQVSVVSEDTAAQVGYFTGGPTPSTPDFFVEVAGVGGTTQNVPGFYMNSLSVTTNGGPITWTHVPVLVLDIADPSDGVGALAGILGTNLFTDRDLIFNGGTGSPFVGISPLISSQWTNTTGGSWSEDLKWSLGYPDGADVPANFLGSITAPSSIAVDARGYTVGSMKFDNTNRYTLNGPGTITLAGMSIGAAQIEVVTGSHTINAPLAQASDLLVTVTPAGSTLTVSDDVSTVGTVAFGITKAGAGTLEMKNVRAGSLTVNAGALKILSNGAAGGTSNVTSLNVVSASGAKLDLTNNAMVIDYTGASPMPTIAARIKTGFNNAAWTGAGIDSSTAAAIAANVADQHKTGLGFAENSLLGLTTFRGQSVDATSLLIRYTYNGDSNLDGKVDSLDFNALATGFGLTNQSWINGDYNFDGKVDSFDFNAMATNFGLTLPSFAASPGSVVPEPGIGLALLGMPLLRRKRR